MSEEMQDVGEIASLLDAYAALEKRAAEIKSGMALLKTQMQKHLDDHQVEVGSIGGKRAVSWRTVTSTTLDQNKLRAEHPEIFAACQTTREARRFVVTYGGDK